MHKKTKAASPTSVTKVSKAKDVQDLSILLGRMSPLRIISVAGKSNSTSLGGRAESEANDFRWCNLYSGYAANVVITSKNKTRHIS